MSDGGQLSRGNVIFFAVLAACVGVYFLVLKPYTQRPQGLLHPAIGAKIHYLSLEGFEGTRPAVDVEDLKGKVVLLNFWATWCPPCREELPHIVELGKKYRDRSDYQLLAVACPGEGDTPQTFLASTQKFLAEKKYDLPTYVDPGQQTFSGIITATTAGGGIPLTLILDRNNIVRGIWEGYAPSAPAEMEKLIDELLANIAVGVVASDQ